MRGKILGRGEDGVQLGPNHRYMLGWIVLLTNGKIHFSRHVHIDERSMLRPTIEGGFHSPHEWNGPLEADPAAVSDAAAELEPIA
jgi:hypothetical protein